ncbi:hypothetical protein AB0G32_37060 [Streptomyces sp. NPDC023723]|uniref:hypothetical protein n=1 Tax=Streptomyces sp. NPDC023723 TaxID=3154323 RepID=UPI0033CF5711
MRRPAALLSVTVAVGVSLIAPAPAATADTATTEVVCQDLTAFPEYIRHLFLSPDTPTVVENFDEHPENLSCYEWSGSAPATITYTVSYVMNGIDHPDGYTGVLTMGHGFGLQTPMPGYYYRASFTLQP